jgi:hypothetical protein
MRSLGMVAVGGLNTIVTAGARAMAERADVPVNGVRRHRLATIDFRVVFRFLISVAGIAAGVTAAWDTWGRGAGLAACCMGAFLIEMMLRPEKDDDRRR